VASRYKAGLEKVIAAFDQTAFGEPLLDSGNCIAADPRVRRDGAKIADADRRLLRAQDHRPSKAKPAERCDEDAPFHALPGDGPNPLYQSRQGRANGGRCASGLFAVIEPGEAHTGAAAIVVVLDQKPWADAPHPHPACILAFGLERQRAVVEEGEGAVMRLRLSVD